MKLKGSAPVILNPHPSLLHAAEVVDRVVRNITGSQPTLTAFQEEGHSEGSRHYGLPGDVRGRALDIRIHTFTPKQTQAIVEELRRRLPVEEFDIVLKPDHIHCEVDPKG